MSTGLLVVFVALLGFGSACFVCGAWFALGATGAFFAAACVFFLGAALLIKGTR